MKKVFRPDQYALCILFMFIGLWYPFSHQALATQKNFQPEINLHQLQESTQSTPAIIVPIAKSIEISPPSLTAKSAIVIDVANGETLFAKNEQVSLPPASLTKLMTALVAFELYDLHDVITINGEELTEGNRIKLIKGEQITVLDLLRGLLIFSGNDAAMALANHHPQGYAAFIQAMNEKATELQMPNTSFANPAGLDHTIQLSSAKDISTLMRVVLEKPELREILGMQTYQVRSYDQKYLHTLYTTNQLLGKFPGVLAGKTGSTFLAGECLVTLVEQHGHPLITVVLGSEQRFTETEQLINWAYAQYEWREIRYQAGNEDPISAFTAPDISLLQ